MTHFTAIVRATATPNDASRASNAALLPSMRAHAGGRGGCTIGFAPFNRRAVIPRRPHRRRPRAPRPSRAQDPAIEAITTVHGPAPEATPPANRAGSGVPMPTMPAVHRRADLGWQASQPLPELSPLAARRPPATRRPQERVRVADAAARTDRAPQRRADDPARVPRLRQDTAYTRRRR